MNVEMESVALHARMAELFGVPTPTQREDDEVFGPYRVDGLPKYWVYDPFGETWRVIDPAPVPSQVKTRHGICTADVGSASGAIQSASHLPAPMVDLSHGSLFRDRYLVHDGWLFAWHLEPEQRNWELLFAGRQ